MRFAADPSTSSRDAEAARRARNRRGARAAAIPGILIGAVLASTILLAQGNQRLGSDADQSSPDGFTGQPKQDAGSSVTLAIAHDFSKVLNDRAQAVITRDAARWQQNVTTSQPEFAAHQKRTFANLTKVPIHSWKYDLAHLSQIKELTPERRKLLGVAQAWVVPTTLQYHLANQRGEPLAGQTVIRRQKTFTIARENDRLVIAATSDGKTTMELWDLGPVEVKYGNRSLVLGTRGGPNLNKIAQDADRAAKAVDDVWGTDWPRMAIIQVPKNQSQMAKLLSRNTQAGLNQVAAVTTGAFSAEKPNQATTGDRIIVNPAGYKELGNSGQLVVLTHEMTHVATRVSTRGQVPIWLSEGFADFVAYRRSGVAAKYITEEAKKAYAAGTMGTTFPDATAFNPAKGDISPAYSGSWLLADLIAKQSSPAKLVAFYRDIATYSGSEPHYFANAMQHQIGITPDELLAQWQKRLASPRN